MLLLPCVTVQLWGSSQYRLGKIQRETLSKTVRDSEKRWPALTVKNGMFWGDAECVENRTPRDQCYSMGGHTETLLKGELRQVPRLGRDLGLHICVHGQGALALITKNSEAENKPQEQEDMTQHGPEWRIQDERVTGLGLEGRS